MAELTEKIKYFARKIFSIIAFFPYIYYVIASSFIKKERIFSGISQFLSLFPGTSGSYLRVAFYNHAMVSCPQSCAVGFLSTFASPDTSIGENTNISICVNIGRVKIGDNCLISPYVMITAGKNQHRFDSCDKPINQQSGDFHPVIIGQDCWIGNGAIVMADVGEGCVIAAGSVVTKPIPPYSIAAGNPARVVGERGCAPA